MEKHGLRSVLFCCYLHCYQLSFSRKNILDNNSKPRYYKYVNKRKPPLAVAVPLIVTNLSQQLQRLQKSLPQKGGFRRGGSSF